MLNKTKSKLAIHGGPPVRTAPYPIHSTMFDDAEEKQLIETIRKGHLSGFSARPGDRFLGGEKVIELEEHFAKKFNVKYAVSTNSATSSLHSAISAIGIREGDEVITSPFTMSATGSSIVMQNAVPVFADIEDRTFGLDPASVEKLISKKTKAILTVNILGHPSRLKELKEIANKYNLFLIEDNAQSPMAKNHGKLAGTVGDIGILSLNYHKCIQTGEGGIALTNDPNLAERLRLIRNHGEVVVGKINKGHMTNQLGWNYRLSELQAAVGIPQIKKLDYLTKIRSDLASMLIKELEPFNFLTPPVIEPESSHVFYLFAMRFHEHDAGFSRKAFVDAMKAEGIALNEGYVLPMYLEPMYQNPHLTPQLNVALSSNFLKDDLAEHYRNNRSKDNYEKCPYEGHIKENYSNQFYSPGICPIAEKMHESEICITDICKYPNSEKEILEFVEAVKKVSDGLLSLNA